MGRGGGTNSCCHRLITGSLTGRTVLLCNRTSKKLRQDNRILQKIHAAHFYFEILFKIKSMLWSIKSNYPLINEVRVIKGKKL